MPILSAITIMLITHIFLCKRTKKGVYISLLTLDIIFQIAWPEGYFIGSGDTHFATSQAIVEMCLFIYAIYYLLGTNVHIPKTVFYGGIIFLFFILMGTIYEVLFPVDFPIINNYDQWDAYAYGKTNKEAISIDIKKQIQFYYTLINYLINVFIIKSIFTKTELIYIGRKISKVFKGIVILGMGEFVLKNILSMPETYFIIKGYILGKSNNAVQEPTMRGALYSLEGITSEPSHFILTLFFFCVVGCMLYKYEDKLHACFGIKKYILGSVFLMVLSGGFSAFWYIFMLTLVFLVLKYELYKMDWHMATRYIKYIVVLVFVGAVVLYTLLSTVPGYEYRLNSAIQVVEYLTSNRVVMPEQLDSSLPRLMSCYDVFMDFLERPLLGLGMGIQSAHDSFATMLSFFGCLGTFAGTRFILLKGRFVKHYDIVMLVLLYFVSGIPLGFTDLQVPLIALNQIYIFELTSIYIGEDNDT